MNGYQLEELRLQKIKKIKDDYRHKIDDINNFYKNIEKKVKRNSEASKQIKIEKEGKLAEVEVDKAVELEKFTKLNLAKRIHLSYNTYVNWTEKYRVVESPYLEKIQKIFETEVLQPHLTTLARVIFDIVPVELISIWMAKPEQDEDDQEIILIRGTSLLLLGFNNKIEFDYIFRNDEIHKPLISDESITTVSAHNGKTENLCGKQIINHKSKAIPGNRSGHLGTGECRSLLKLPKTRGTRTGLSLIALISLENKLNKKEIEKTIKSKKGEWFKIESGHIVEEHFSNTEIEAVSECFDKYLEEKLHGDLVRLGYQSERKKNTW